MSNGGNVDINRLKTLIEQYRRAPAATAADRAQRDQMLDELQDAVGMSGKMATENDILRRADKLLQGK